MSAKETSAISLSWIFPAWYDIAEKSLRFFPEKSNTFEKI